MRNENKKHISMSSGSFKGYFSLGAMNILEEKGYNILSLSGISIGAIISGLLSIGYSTGEIKEQFFDKITKMSDIYSLRTLNASPLYERIRHFIGDRTLGDTKIPIFIGVTSLRTKNLVTLSSKGTPDVSLSQAMFLSAFLKMFRGPRFSIPGIGLCCDGAYSQRMVILNNQGIMIDCGDSCGGDNTITLTPTASESIGRITSQTLNGITTNPLSWYKILGIPEHVAGLISQEREILYREGQNAARSYIEKNIVGT